MVPVPDAHVHHYDVALTVDPERAHLSGHARLAVTEAGDGLSLSFANLRVDSLHVNGRPAAFNQRGDAVQVSTGPAQADTLTVDVWYVGSPQVGLSQDTVEGQPLLFTDNWPDDVRGWLPGTHHPARPATLALTLSSPAGLEAVASGESISRTRDAETLRTQWSLATPVPTYTFGFAVGPFTTAVDRAALSDGALLIEYYLLSESNDPIIPLPRMVDAITFFDEILGPYPFASLAVVQLTHPYAGMEFAAMPSVQAALFDEPGGTWTHTAEAVAVHEVAHQWAGNAWSAGDWRDLWLVEGLATYLTALFYAAVDGEEDALTKLASLREQLPAREAQQPLYPEDPVAPDAHLTRDVYNRGALVLHHLHEEIGADAFSSVLRRLFSDPGAPLTTDRLEDVVDEVADIDAGTFFASYVYGSTLPPAPSTFPRLEALPNDAVGHSLRKSFPVIFTPLFHPASVS